MIRLVRIAFILVPGLLGSCTGSDAAPSPSAPRRPSKLVIVIEENKSFSQIIGNPDAPYINRLAREGALFTAAFAITHPSQPNYIAFFSGGTQGVADNDAHPHERFTSPNLGSKLLDAGLTFVGYSEELPEVGFDGESAGDEASGFYRRKHNPWVNWQDATEPTPPNKLPPIVNRAFSDFPSDFEQLPDVSIVVPNQKHDMHDGSIAEGDDWLERHLGPYVEWSATNNGLLLFTFDEDNGSEFNRIPIFLHGPGVRAGEYGDVINHYDVLRTIEEMYGLPHTGATEAAGGMSTAIWIEAR